MHPLICTLDILFNPKHPNRVQDLLTLTKVISAYQGLIYKTLSSIETVFKHILNEKATKITMASAIEQNKKPLTMVKDLFTQQLY